MINYALFRKEITENRVKFFICFSILAVLAAAIPLLYTFIDTFFRNIDISYFVDPQELDFLVSSYDNYAWSQWTAKNLTQLAALTSIILGMGSLAGEISYGTAPFLVSKPITRRGIFITKLSAGIFLLGCCLFGSSILLILISMMKGFTFNIWAFLVSTVITFAGAIVIYTGTAVFSVLIHEPVKAGVVAALFWGALSIFGFFKAAAPFSFFYQMKAVPYWLYGQSPLVPLGIFLVIYVILFRTGVFFWSQREF
ncbi:MAG: hypothetical protein Q7J85_04845 [Bacillota bacterium]|nr:hypothetical protein [Bacillota bacterium]